MAKTIQEMAMDYASEKWEGEHFTVAFCDSMEDYQKGANAVLEEIEKCLDNPSMIQGYSDILAKVQELKGE